MTTSSASIKRRILKQRGVELAKHTRRPMTHDELPSTYPKTQLMKYIELKFGNKLENLIFDGTVRATAKRLHIDYSTVSKWRKLILEAKDHEFWKQFEKRGGEM